jgi:hypothetical protein
VQPISSRTVAARIVARLGYAMWRHRVALLGGAILIGALATFQVGVAGPNTRAGGNDCADTTMAALTRATDDAARAAYACFDPALRSGEGEEAFVQNMRRRSGPRPDQVTRVADHRTANGGRVVFYTVDVGHESVGYIIYLSAAGKVERID